MLLKNDLQFYPIDHTLMSQKDNQDRARDELVAEFLILFFLVRFLGSNTHKDKLEELIAKIDRPSD